MDSAPMPGASPGATGAPAAPKREGRPMEAYKSRWNMLEREGMWYLMILATYLIYGQLWGQSAVEKWQANGVPAWFKAPAAQGGFGGTFLDSFPGLTVSWYLIAFMETFAWFLIVVSVILLEWRPGLRRPVFGLALGVSALTFAVLAFGQLLQGSFSGSFQLFLYFGIALITPFAVDWLDERVHKGGGV